MKVFSSASSLKKIIKTNVIYTLISITLIFLIYIYFYYSFMENQVQATFKTVAENLETTLNDSIKSIDSAGKKVAYSSDVQTALFTENPDIYMQYHSSAEDIIKILENNNPYIEDIGFYGNNGRMIYSAASYLGKKAFFEKAYTISLSKKEVNNQTPFFISIQESAENISSQKLVYVIPVRNISPGKLNKETSALCMISFNVQPIFNHLNIDTSKKGLVAFFFNDAIIAANQTITNQNLAALLAIRNDSHSSYINGTRYLNDNIIVPNTTFRFVFMIPRNVILKNLTVISNISLLLLIITIVVLGFFSSHAVSGITNPLMQIVNGMKNVQEDKSSRIQPPNLLELQQLAEEINYTLDTIKLATEKEKRMMDDLHQSQIAQNQAMMRAYQSQIHPHFLFNTLECMRSMAHHYKIRPIETLVSSMSLMFRYSLHANLVVTLKEELQHVQHYYNVMNERFPGRYKIRISVSEEALQHPILSMILQPIAENTFSHGFVNKKNPCILYVQGKIEIIHDSKMLSLKITDNGCGISEERLQEILSDLKKPSETDKTHHIGLYNINQRLKLYFGSEYKIKINSKEGYFTQIELLIPEKS